MSIKSSRSGKFSFFITIILITILTLSIVFSATVVAIDEPSQIPDEPKSNLAHTVDRDDKIHSKLDGATNQDTQLVSNTSFDKGNSGSFIPEKQRYVITFKNSSSRNISLITQTGARVIGGQNINITPVLFAVGSNSVQSKIKKIPTVKQVTKDKSIRISPPTNVSTSIDTSSNNQSVPWGVRTIDGRSASDYVSNQSQSDVNVAVLDSGIDYTHSDINNNVVWGANFVGGVEQYGIEKADDNHGHGTKVAGLIAAEDNDRGIVGVAPHTKIYSMKVLNENNFGYYSWWIRGLDAAIKGPDKQLGSDDDADIVSMSIGGDSYSTSLENAIQSASKHSILVTAAMNSGDGDPSTNEIHYPAKYSETIAVAATNKQNQTTTFSSEGAEVDVAAPGTQILTLSKGGGTSSFTGTSASTPLVSGTLALMIAENQSATSREYETILRDTAMDIESAGVDKKAGHGLIDADTAVQQVNPGSFDIEINSTNTPITAGDTFKVVATVQNTGSELATKNIELYLSSVGSNSTRLTLSGGESQNTTLSVDTGQSDSGNLTVELSTPDDSATQDIRINSQVSVPPGAVYNNPNGIPASYDNDNNGKIDQGELVDGLQAYSNNNISQGDLVDLLQAYSYST